ALGIPFIAKGVSETQAASRSLLLANHEPEHVHCCMRDQIEGRGCLIHPDAKCALESCDVCVFGTPCPPFSQFRGKRYHENSVASHDLVSVTMEDARDMLVLGQHKAVIMEQVPGFDMPEHSGASEDATFMR
ncbi:unnamed protein product, partial [Symbiodinium necroappetens]